MIWILLRSFLAGFTAWLFKNKVLKTDLNKFTAVLLATIWGIFWGIAAAFAYEYIYGEGTFNNSTLVRSIVFTSIISYYGFTTKLKLPNFKNRRSGGGTEKPSIEKLTTDQKVHAASFMQKLLFVKTGARFALSFTLAIFLLSLVYVSEVVHINEEFKIANGKFYSSTPAKVAYCQQLLKIREYCKLYGKAHSNPNSKYDYLFEEDNCMEMNSTDIHFAETECVPPSSLDSQYQNIWNSINQSLVVLFCIYTGLFLFTVLLAGRSLILEKTIGWKRLSIVIGCAFTGIMVMYISIISDHFYENELVLWMLIATLIPAVTIISILKGKLLFEWVKDGFQE